MEKRNQERVALISKGAKEITKTEWRNGKFSPIKFALTSLFLIAPATGWTAPELLQLPPPVTPLTAVEFNVDSNSSIETDTELRIEEARTTPVQQLVIVTSEEPGDAVWAGHAVNPEAPGSLEQDIHCRVIGEETGLVARSQSILSEGLVDCTLSQQ